jgi:hypothetical protein
MKFRPFVLSILVIAVVALASCTKNYTCHCNIYYSGYPGLPDSSVQEYGITDTKSNATSKCKAQSGTYSNNGISTVETCYIY